jgi:hypothetical protein
MKSKCLVVAIALCAASSISQSSRVQAEEEIEVELEEREAVGVTKGPRCTFTRAEKLGMLLWLFPPAGAVYTPFACKKDVFSKKVDVNTD